MWIKRPGDDVVGPFFVRAIFMLAAGLGLCLSSTLADAQTDLRAQAQRVADIAYRIAAAGVARCPTPTRTTGLTFQHLGQFEAADRPTILSEIRLDLGPAVLAVAKDSPAAATGLRRGDVILEIDGIPAPPGAASDAPHNQLAAQKTADAIDAAVHPASDIGRARRLVVLRDGDRLAFVVPAVPTCPSRTHLANSNQRNAFADGHHIFLTAGLVRLLGSDSELAFVIAHEMAHNILAHAQLLRANGVKRGALRMLGKGGRIMRTTEREADALGGELMIDAGYDLTAAAAALEAVDGGPSLTFMSAHDSVGSRVKALKALAQRRADTDTARQH